MNAYNAPLWQYIPASLGGWSSDDSTSSFRPAGEAIDLRRHYDNPQGTVAKKQCPLFPHTLGDTCKAKQHLCQL